jgi:hypothetical protein
MSSYYYSAAWHALNMGMIVYIGMNIYLIVSKYSSMAYCIPGCVWCQAFLAVRETRTGLDRAWISEYSETRILYLI